MIYENPDDYNEDEDRRKDMLKKALQYMDKKDKDADEMTPEEIVEAAEKFDNFITSKGSQ